jgi:MFS family permease
MLAEPHPNNNEGTNTDDEATDYVHMDNDNNQPLLDQPTTSPQDLSSRERVLYTRVVALVFITCVDLVSFSAIQSFLPLFLRSVFPNMTPGQIGSSSGAIIGVFFAARCVSTIVFGSLSDIFGRKWFLVFSLVVSCICTSIFALGRAVWLLILIRFIQGFFSSTLELAKAGLVDITTNDWLPSLTRSLIFSYIVAIITAVRATATGLGGIIVGTAIAAGFAGNAFNFTCAFSGVVVGLGIIVALFMQETKAKEPSKSELHETLLTENDRSTLQSLWHILHDRVRFTLIFIFFLGSFSNAASNMVWVLIAQESIKYGGLGFTPLLTGVIFLVYGLSCFFLQITVFKRMMTYLGLMTTYRVGSCAQLAQCCLMAIIVYVNGAMINMNGRTAVVWTLLVLFCFVVAIGFTGSSVAQTMIVNVTIDMKIPGVVQGMNGSADTLGRALGPVIFGFLYSL